MSELDTFFDDPDLQPMEQQSNMLGAIAERYPAASPERQALRRNGDRARKSESIPIWSAGRAKYGLTTLVHQLFVENEIVELMGRL